MDAIFNFVFEVVLRALGLGVLKILTFGRYKGASSYLSNGKAPGQFPNGLDSNEKIDHGKKLSGHGATAH